MNLFVDFYELLNSDHFPCGPFLLDSFSRTFPPVLLYLRKICLSYSPIFFCEIIPFSCSRIPSSRDSGAYQLGVQTVDLAAGGEGRPPHADPFIWIRKEIN